MNATLLDLSVGMNNKQRITLEISEDFRSEFNRLKDAPVNVEIKKFYEKRSKNANDMCWALCTQIGQAISPPIPKEEVYRNAIRDVGVYEPLPISDETVESFCRRWKTKGVGWFADIVDDSKIPGYKLVFAYYGSSTYNTKEMSILLDYIVNDAQQMEIETLSERELSLLKEEWHITQINDP